MATWNLVNADDAVKARAAIGVATGTHIDDSGAITADGVADVSTAFGNRVDGLPSGTVLELGPGTYYAPDLRDVTINKSLIIRGVPGKTKILGDGTLTAADYEQDVMFHLTTEGASIQFEDIIFEDQGVVVGYRDLHNLGDIGFHGCTFINCGAPVAVIVDSSDLATQLAAEETLTFNDFRMSDCKIDGCELGVWLRGRGGWNSVSVHDNVFTNVGYAAVWTGYEYTADMEPTVFQPLQGRVNVHDNVITTVRLTTYSGVSNPAANGIIAMGQSVIIHDNHIEDVDRTGSWDDCEGIYTKARYTDVHDNVLVNAGGSEAAIIAKGVDYDASTTIAAGSNGDTLPQATINVASTEGFGPPFGTHASAQSFLVETTEGWEVVSFTSKTATSFTGCSGGTGTLATGDAVRGETNLGALTGVSRPGKIHDNTIVFTRDDELQRGIMTAVPGIWISNNMIVGATNQAINARPGDTVIDGNVVVEHHGSTGIVVGGSVGGGAIVRNNSFIDYDGSYAPGASSYAAIYVTASNVEMRDILIEGNYFRNELTAAGARNAASAKMRFCQIIASGTNDAISDITVRNNRARNINSGLIVSADGPVSNLKDIDNDWLNENGDAITDGSAHATAVTTRSAKPRIKSIANHSAPSLNTDVYDQLHMTAMTSNISSMTTNLSGNPVDGQRLTIRFTAAITTARTITWGASFAGTLLAQTASGQTNTHIQHLMYDSTAAKWVGTYADSTGY